MKRTSKINEDIKNEDNLKYEESKKNEEDLKT